MAPIPPYFPRKDQEAVANFPLISDAVYTKSTHFKEEPLKKMQSSRFTRCSSLSSEEESFQLFGHDRQECFRSLAVSVKMKTSVSSFTVCNNENTLNREVYWPGVSCGLDEDESRKKAKSKVALELEPEKKTAVENDDSSTSENFGSFSFFEYEKYTVTTRSQIQLKNEKCELKAKEIFMHDRTLVVPYSIQETLPKLERVEGQPEKTLLQVQLPPLSPSSSDLTPKEDPVSSSEEDCAHSYIEEIHLEDDKSIENKNKRLFRRHAVKRVKRSVWCITEPEPPAVQPKRKKTCKSVKPRKQRQARGCVHNQSVPEVSKVDEPGTFQNVQQSSKRASKRKVPNSPARGEPKDSGVYSSSAGSASAGSGSGSGSSSGSFSAGSGSGGGFGARGNGGGNDKGDDGDKGKKYPWWHLPDRDNVPVPDSEKEKKREDSGCKEKMEVDMSGFQNFLPSKVDNPEQCHGPGWGGVATPKQKLQLMFLPQDIQHSSYCSKTECLNVKCKPMKADIMHMRAHKGWNQECPQCVNTYSIVQQHAKFCRRDGCRVPECNNARNGNVNKDKGQPVQPFQPERIPVQVPRWDAWVPTRTLYCTPLMDAFQIDGKVIFRNSTLLPVNYFCEHCDYNVIRKDKLGGGSNGAIFPVYLQSDRSLQMVVKETNYRIPLEEVEVYKLLGDHEHIVKHFGGTFRGSEGKASIFMEKCDECLFSRMEKLGRRLFLGEAMFYFNQILHAVDYLHTLPTPVIHKDIKAKNVLLTEEYTRAKLADFDSAKRLSDEFTEAGLQPLGTKGFASPEVLGRKPHGRPADVYSLGCFLIELLVGVPSRDTLWEQIDKLRELDYELAQLVEECVQECPEDRPTVRALLEKPVVKKYTSS